MSSAVPGPCDAGIAASALPCATPHARATLAASILGSSVAFIDGSVVNVALPALGRDLGASPRSLLDHQRVSASARCVDPAHLVCSAWNPVNAHLGAGRRFKPNNRWQGATIPNIQDRSPLRLPSPIFLTILSSCDVYASDLNPIACMLTWGALNIIGASKEKRAEIEAAQKQVAAAVDAEITQLGIEHDAHGNRAKAYLYCVETRCPKTGWMVPMAPSWVIATNSMVVAKLVPDHDARRHLIEIHSGVSAAELAEAQHGTVRDGRLIHPMNPEPSGVEIKTIRGDYRDADGTNRNRLRLWEKSDFVPRADDIFRERLYCIQWITKASLGKGRRETFFAARARSPLI
jgi:putative DNA methylase